MIIILSTILVGFLFASMLIFCISVYITFICMGCYRLFISPFCLISRQLDIDSNVLYRTVQVMPTVKQTKVAICSRCLLFVTCE